jgi:hypothetical protein
MEMIKALVTSALKDGVLHGLILNQKNIHGEILKKQNYL